MGYLERLLSAWQGDFDLQESVIEFLQFRDFGTTHADLNERAERQDNLRILVQNEIIEKSDICTTDQFYNQIKSENAHLQEVIMQSLLIRAAIALDEANPIALLRLSQEVAELLKNGEQNV